VVPVLETAGSQDEVEFTVRPEKIELSVERPTPNARFAARLPTSPISGPRPATRSPPTSVGDRRLRQNAVSAESPAELGDNVWLSWQAQHSYALERSGQAPEPAGEPAPAAAH
jgi:spermidine/putrescine transport system ATP-binding protein